MDNQTAIIIGLVVLAIITVAIATSGKSSLFGGVFIWGKRKVNIQNSKRVKSEQTGFGHANIKDSEDITNVQKDNQ